MLTAAIIGTGGMGGVHSKCYKTMQENGQAVTVIAAADIIPEKTAGVIETHPEARSYASLDELLANETPDIVHLTTPSDTHAALAIHCLKRGIHVFSEKPIALNLKDAQAMCDAAQASKGYLMIGQVVRFSEQYRYLKSLIENLTYGKLCSLRLYRAGQAPGWDARGWFLETERSGRAPVDLHLHDTDFLNYLFGKPQAVESHIIDDNDSLSYINTRFDYPDMDIRAEGGWVKAPLPFTFGYEAIFDEAMVVMKDDRGTLYPVNGKAQPVTPENSLTMESDTNLSDMGPYVAEIAYFHECIRKNTPPVEVTPESARLSLEIVLKEIESAKIEKKIRF